ncbi:hypothetical protein [Streptomyces sp. bgisy034]|uniref:hypothetical protein n=1 Tax=Streptomyces sp. bgisy034 TaxID=3413774 RepID=UPI003EBAE5C6
MTDHVAGPNTPASSERVDELHRLADEDYAKGQQQRAHAHPYPTFAPPAPTRPATEPSGLAVAIGAAQRAFHSDEPRSVREALQNLLRALGADPARCPAALPGDTSPCDGPPAVTVLDAANAGADGCERHAARLLAKLPAGRVYGLPNASVGAALRVFQASGGERP